MKFDLIQISSIIVIFLTLLLALYFIQTRKNKLGNQLYFAGLLGVFATMTLCSLILSSGINLFKMAHIGNQVIFLAGPLLYFYIHSHLNPNKDVAHKKSLHVLPFIAASIYLIVKFYYANIAISCRANHILVGSTAFAHSFIYFFHSVQAIKDKQNNANTEKTGVDDIKWLKYIVYGCFSLLLIKMIFFIVWDISGYYNGCNEIVNLYFLTSFILLNVFTYFILVKPDFFQEVQKYRHSTLKDDEKERYKKELLLLFEQDKIYKNPLLSLNLLSKKLSIPSRYLSQIINENLNKSYYELVNWYRIQECMEKLADPNNDNRTILDIAYDAGFNSKSTFNTYFVKFAGRTPKEFRKNPHKTFNFKVEVMAN